MVPSVPPPTVATNGDNPHAPGSEPTLSGRDVATAHHFGAASPDAEDHHVQQLLKQSIKNAKPTQASSTAKPTPSARSTQSRASHFTQYPESASEFSFMTSTM